MFRKLLFVMVGVAALGVAAPAYAYGPAPVATPPAGTPPAATPPANPPAAPPATGGDASGSGSANAILGPTVNNDSAASGHATTQGSSVDFRGAGMTPGEQVAIYLQGVYLTTVTADATGGFNAQITIPNGAAIGTDTLTAVGQTGKNTVSFPLQVTAAQPAPVIAAIASHPGSNRTAEEAAAGAALAIVAGGLSVLGMRRRRAHTGIG